MKLSGLAHINLAQKMKEIIEPWTPHEIARFNDQVVRLALYEGSYHWHVHEGEDELFYVLKGQITIQIRGSEDIVLKEGEIAVVSKGIEHCPKSEGKSYVLMIEPLALNSAGNH